MTYNNSLTDVDTTGLVANKIMKYDGLKWIVSDDANGIADVPNDSQKYVWEFNNWVPLSESLGLNDLNDVFINEPPQIG